VPVEITKTKTKTNQKSKNLWRLSPEFCERNRQAQLLAWQQRDRKEWGEKMRLAQQASRERGTVRTLTPEGLERLREVGRNRRGTTTSVEVRAKQSAAKKGKKFTLEHRARIGAAMKLKMSNPEIKEKVSKAVSKPIMTPSGAFASVGQAEAWATQHGLINARDKIRKWIKTHPESFYFIKKETI
jgi:hypothetical protein